MILSETVKVKWHGNNRKWYESKGYVYTKRGDEFETKIEDIMPKTTSQIKVKPICDICNSQQEKEISYEAYINNVNTNKKLYICHECLKRKEYEKYIGEKIGRLTITKYLGYFADEQKQKQHWFECKCDCGNTCVKRYNYLYHSYVGLKSCGCWNSEHTIMFNKETKTGFNNKYIKKDDGYYITIYKNNKEKQMIVDEYGFNFLQKANRTVTLDNRGYAYISQEDSNGKQLFLHNLFIFGMDYYNKNMNILVDHINSKNILDNRLSNLRPANDSENACNRKRNSNNTTGIKGFTIDRPDDMIKIKIKVRIGKNYKRICKMFDLSPKGLEEAIKWNLYKRKELHDEFTNYGFDTNNKTEEEIIREQSEIFIHNLNNTDKYYFYNQIRLDKLKN